jgi:hypothetical protein
MNPLLSFGDIVGLAKKSVFFSPENEMRAVRPPNFDESVRKQAEKNTF